MSVLETLAAWTTSREHKWSDVVLDRAMHAFGDTIAVPAWRPFLEDLPPGVLDWLGDAPPETLTDATILLPNRRAARAFSFALGKLAGERPVLLPQVRPLAELEEDELPPAADEPSPELALDEPEPLKQTA